MDLVAKVIKSVLLFQIDFAFDRLWKIKCIQVNVHYHKRWTSCTKNMRTEKNVNSISLRKKEEEKVNFSGQSARNERIDKNLSLYVFHTFCMCTCHTMRQMKRDYYGIQSLQRLCLMSSLNQYNLMNIFGSNNDSLQLLFTSINASQPLYA